MIEINQKVANIVRRKYKSITDKIDNLRSQLVDLQTVCPHTDVTKKFCGDTGNYDPSADLYWIDWYCPDCGKRWRTDQDRENTLKPGRIIK